MPYISLPTTPQTSTPTTPHTAPPTANPTAPLTTPHSAPPTAIPTASLTTPHNALPTANPTASLTTPHTALLTSSPTAPPTAPHTAPHTALPTANPTASLTTPHTAPATANPTTSPTTPNTSPPTTPQTSPPTTPPTAPPTANPTASLPTPHTAPPTANPTASLPTPHTAPPTANPTASPTTPYTSPPTTPHSSPPPANPTTSLTTPHTAPPTTPHTSLPTSSPTTAPTALPSTPPTSNPTALPTAPPTTPHTTPPTVYHTTPPTVSPNTVCEETLVDEKTLCAGVNSVQLQPSGSVSAPLCNFSLSEYACSSVASSLSSDNLNKLLTCKAATVMSNSTETWKLLFQKVAGVLENALSAYSSQNLSNSLPVSSVLDAIGEVTISNFSASELTNASFIAAWFQVRLTPFLPSVSVEFLSCLSTKNFSCDSYQAVVLALSHQASFMEAVTKQDVFRAFIQPFLSRDDLTDAACLAKMTSSAEWLEKNFGQFSGYAAVEYLQRLNANFSSFESLSLLNPTQVAELTLSSGALNSTDKIGAVFDRLEKGNSFVNVEEFLMELNAASEILQISPTVSDVMMNRTFTIIEAKFEVFETHDWVVWFEENLIPILPSFSTQMLLKVTVTVNCTNYHVIVKGLSMAYTQMPVQRRKEIAASLVVYLKQTVDHINRPTCKQGITNDSEWLDMNLGQFFTYVPYSDLAEFNISMEAVFGSLTDEQKVERILIPGLLEDETSVRELFASVVNSQNHLVDFFNTLKNMTAQSTVLSVNTTVSSIILNMTLVALENRFQFFDSQTFALWFQTYLRIFLPGIGPDTLSVIPLTISCKSYTEIVKGCDDVFSNLTPKQTNDVYRFTMHYLTRKSSPGNSCVQGTSNSSDWLMKSFGQFSIRANFSDLISLNKDFNGVEAAALLTPSQLAQLCSDPSGLSGPQDVQTVMSAVDTQQLSGFFDLLSPNISLKQAFLQAVLNRQDLWSSALSDTEVSLWITVRLHPLLSTLSTADVSPYFTIIASRGCDVRQTAVTVLSSVRTALDGNTQREIYNSIQQLLADPPLRCYAGGSYFQFLQSSFLQFGLPDLSRVLSLIPQASRPQVLSSISPSELSQFLNAPQAVGNTLELCQLLSVYNQTAVYLQTAPLGSQALARQVLSCVWPQVLQLDLPSEVDKWFDLRLLRYLPSLTLQLISSAELQSASCLSYRKLISVLGSNYNYSETNFSPEDVYSSIKEYLSNGGSPRCYNAADPQLNSTDWFVSYIGVFISYVSLVDLNSFVSSDQIRVFLKDPGNLQLLNSTAGIQYNVAEYYITQLYILDQNFNPTSVPPQFLCGIPAVAFEPLGEAESLRLIQSINMYCNGTQNPQITATLADNLPSLSTNTIELLGNQSVGLTEGQINAAPPAIFKSSLATLSTVDGWSQGQADAIVETLIQANYVIDSDSSLLALGTLVKGLPSDKLSSIQPTTLLSVSQNPTFISNMLAAPQVLQMVYVMQIVSIDDKQVLQNVPDQLASSIPPVLLAPQGSVNISLINQKQWTQEQAKVLFGSVASVSQDAEELSVPVLQGFSCTSVQTVSTQKVKQMVRACRHRPGRRRVQLQESQLMCMNNYLKDETLSSFSDLPPEVLLYYSYENVQQVNCRSYFSAVGQADFSVLSGVLNKPAALFANARSCLGITGNSLSKDHVAVLGNLTCTLDPVYISNSDPSIIESLKNCMELSDSQISAVQTLLQSGNTPYGNSSTWGQQTLQRLANLPLYFTNSFWSLFSPTVKKNFMTVFMPHLRSINTDKTKLKTLFSNCNTELSAKSRMSRSTDCTVGNITAATIADASFPFGYTVTQFDACLDPRVLKDNLAAVAQKVVDSSFQRVILDKLKQVYPAGLADGVVKDLGSVSRQATAQEISSWNISSIDTLAALMDKNNGNWSTAQSQQVILRYLSVNGNSLGTNELNIIKSNLCSLNTSTLQNITPAVLRNANALDLTSCSSDQQSVLYITANTSFRAQLSNGPAYYHMISPYLGGAPVADIRNLASYNITMDISTFRSLSLPVVTSLSVSDVRTLLGSSVSDLKVFENDSVVVAWISAQPQSQLDTLGLSLRGGRVDSSTTTAASVQTSSSSSGSNNNPTTTSTSTTTTTSTSSTSSSSIQTKTTSQSASTYNVTAYGSASALRLAPGLFFMVSCMWILTVT
ncbi:uncharacterized protein LOC130220162 isoform X2 [Danio aesculapii]|uniref:uncharacterized protein LOC130220162 isoform X2 n=1 Tax=Danio aesculapii TaxID=1142201 RepID=UPI0024C0BAB5|nr:uncharacterized protein LOC130220162 isoform X2 [Danio aesculapii]